MTINRTDPTADPAGTVPAPASTAPASPAPASTAPASAAERAYQSTKQAIIQGELAPGTMISELLVVEQLGVSRTPVHEAFLRLAAEGLLTLESRKGAVVSAMSPNEARDVLEMREAVEAAAAARAIAAGNVPDLEPFLAEQSAAAEAGDLVGFIDIDDEFHAAIIAASRNEVAMRFYRLLRDRQQRLRHQLVRVRPEQLGPLLGQHRQLAAALAAEDADRYRVVLGEHIAGHGIAT